MVKFKFLEMINLKEFNFKGYTILEGVISQKEILILKEKLNHIQSIQISEFGKKKMKSINESGIVRCPLIYDSYFLTLINNDNIIKNLKLIFGEYFILSLQNSIIVSPNQKHHQTFYHRDIIHQDFISSKPLGVNVYFCLDDFTPLNGGTTFIPGSHNIETFPTSYDEVIPNVKAGSVIFFNSMIYHKAGINSSTQPRYGINHMYTLPFLKQQINLPLVLKNKYSQDFPINRILGYHSREFSNVKDFRNYRYNKLINE